MNRPLGYRPDPPKASDFDARQRLRVGPLPMVASNRRLVVDVLDQGGLSSCVENAVKQVVRMSHVRQGAATPPLGSRLFGYYLDRAVMREVDQDGGTWIRLAFENMNKFGFCPESDWPYVDDGEAFKHMPPAAAFHAAFDQRKPTEYFRIFEAGSDRIVAVKQAVSYGYGVAFGTQVSMRFCANDLGREPVQPPIGEQIAGGHAMAIVGYDGDTFDVVNSWGTGWGAGGYWRMSANYLGWDQTADLWICRAAPLYSGVQ